MRRCIDVSFDSEHSWFGSNYTNHSYPDSRTETFTSRRSVWAASWGEYHVLQRVRWIVRSTTWINNWDTGKCSHMSRGGRWRRWKQPTYWHRYRHLGCNNCRCRKNWQQCLHRRRRHRRSQWHQYWRRWRHWRWRWRQRQQLRRRRRRIYRKWSGWKCNWVHIRIFV